MMNTYHTLFQTPYASLPVKYWNYRALLILCTRTFRSRVYSGHHHDFVLSNPAPAELIMTLLLEEVNPFRVRVG